ncbi:MAG TPA: hypothetical protein VKX46_01840 [Ktedonobacteraceae bacterium]|nr:hypothetical protein [Ktedonobacteraceae bacterium]
MDLSDFRVTEDEETAEEAAERARIEAMSPEQQQLVLLHYLDQFDAVPSYVENQARFAGEDL